MAHTRHPCDRWGRQPELAHVVFLAVREALLSKRRPHPDSKRTRRAKLEARARKQRFSRAFTIRF